jgi:hypothetical protein
MKSLNLLLVPMVALLIAGTTRADTTSFVWDGTLNAADFANYELLLRPSSSPGYTPTGAITINGASYDAVAPTASEQNDILVQVLHANDINGNLPVSGGGSLNVYIAMNVNKVAGGGDYFTPLTSTQTDPLGVITPNGSTALRMFIDTANVLPSASTAAPKYTSTGETQGTALTNIVNAITTSYAASANPANPAAYNLGHTANVATPYLDFGFGAAVDGSGYNGGTAFVYSVTPPPPSTNYTVYAGLEVTNEYGLGVTFSDPAAFSELAGNNYSMQVEQNSSYPMGSRYGTYTGGASNGSYALQTPFTTYSADPADIQGAVVPEPSSLAALVGIFGVGLAGSRMRRRRKV